ncbi:MAG: nuclear transport factor 2 family protein [Azospirillaceae bacterium]|nr:nuclear transport factor 2 family protein [Azospirillaceae bacterium]
MVKTHALAPQPPNAEADIQGVLAANRRFYRAFAERDVADMEKLWAKECEVRCVHPGWPALSGREQVMRSWRELLSNPGAPGVRHQGEQVSVFGDLGWVVCEEFVAETALVVTNMFMRGGDGWRMVHHQATPISSINAFEDVSGFEGAGGLPPTLH